MRRLLLLLDIFVSAITADAQRCVEKPRFFDNWSVSVAGGMYYPMFYDIKYLLDCSSYVAAVELRKDVTPVLSIGVEADGYYPLEYRERKEYRSLLGPMLHLNLMNLFGGYTGRPRLFEVEAALMPAWGRLYREKTAAKLNDENYLAAKFALDFNFNLGKSRAWTLSLKPAAVCDITSCSPALGVPVPSYDIVEHDKTDLMLYVGVKYKFRNHGRGRHFKYAEPETNDDELQRLNESVNYLRSDIEQRDAEIRNLKLKISALEEQLGK